MVPSMRLLVATDAGERELSDGFADRPLPGGGEDGAPTYGAYLAWLADCLAGKGLAPLAKAASAAAGSPFRPGDISAVELVAEKHGAWYHPARVRVRSGGSCATLCANAALGPRAAAQAKAEHGLLRRIEKERARCYVPRSFGVLREPFRGDEAAVLLCEYFQGFYEFHLRAKAESAPVHFLWDTDRGPRELSAEESRAVWFQTARVLAYCFDPETGREIHPWHHAAGDFIFCPGPGGDPLRLVTVRSYSPLFAPPAEAGEAGPLLGLFFFLISASMRARLDRDNGTGAPIVAGPESVPAAVAGFFAGLSEACGEKGLAGLPEALVRLARSLGTDRIVGACGAHASAVPPESPDAEVLAGMAEEHGKSLAAALRSLP